MPPGPLGETEDAVTRGRPGDEDKDLHKLLPEEAVYKQERQYGDEDLFHSASTILLKMFPLSL